MRDFQETNKYGEVQTTWSYDSQTNPGCGAYPYEVLSSTQPVYPILRKGRDDSKSGPAPFPTPYWAYRCSISPTWGVHESIRSEWRRGCGRHKRIVVKTELEPLGASTLLQGVVATGIGEGKIGYFPDVSVETISIARRNAISQLRSTTVNLGQTIGEIPSTLREITKLLSNIFLALREAKKFNFNQSARILGFGERFNRWSKAGASGYLAWLFGIKPIIDDVNNMMEEIGKASNQPLNLQIKGTATKSVSIGAPSGWDSEGEVLEICQVGYILSLKDSFGASFLGLTNPIGTLWELVPISFVINWFISIGDILSSLDAGSGVRVHSGYQTTVTKGSYKIYDDSYNRTDAQYSVNVFAMRRIVLPAIAIPGLYAKSDISMDKIRTLVALARAWG